jgi:acyl-CoA thioester hydrolase
LTDWSKYIRTSKTREPAPNSAVELKLRVRYAETDQMGMVHHANYLIWFEASRSEFCRVHGIDYRQMEADGLFLPVAEAHCRYISPAFYEDEIVVKTWVIELKRCLLRIGYEVRRGETLLAAGETLQVLVRKPENRPCSFPPEIAAKFVP